MLKASGIFLCCFLPVFKVNFSLLFLSWSDNFYVVKTELLQFDLPAELIAQQPCPIRGSSRLLVMNRVTGELSDNRFVKIDRFLRAGDCLVLNDTKVMAARFFAKV